MRVMIDHFGRPLRFRPWREFVRTAVVTEPQFGSNILAVWRDRDLGVVLCAAAPSADRHGKVRMGRNAREAIARATERCPSHCECWDADEWAKILSGWLP